MKTRIFILACLLLVCGGWFQAWADPAAPGSGDGSTATGANQGPPSNNGTAQPGEGRGRFRDRFKDLTPQQREQLKDFLRKMHELSPEQRAQEAEKHPFFQQIPEERRRLLLEHLQKMPAAGNGAITPEQDALRHRMRERWQKMTPEQKQQIRRFAQQARTMPPEQRRETMKQLPFFKDITPEEKQLLQKRMQRFQQMPPEKREKIMKNYERWQKMTPAEREAARHHLLERKKAGTPSSPSPAPQGAAAPSPAP